MTLPEKLFTRIASEHLGIPTLESRMDDGLDFHDVAVWQIRAALISAYRAGARRQPPASAPDLPVRFDEYEIQPCRRHFEPNQPDITFVEPCEPYEAHFWTLYGHIPGEGVQAIGDFDTREHAEEVFTRITGRKY
jgi:hypothetical protein